MTIEQPSLWLIGTAGFLLRGGFLVLLAPVIALPTPIEVRLLIGGGLGSTGLSPVLLVVVLAFALSATVLLMLAMYGLAWLEVAAFDREFAPTGAIGFGGRQAAARVFSVEAAALSALAVAAIPAVVGAIDVSYQELVRPSGSGALYDRIVAGDQGPLLFLVGALLVIEAISAIATRRALWRSRGVTQPGRGGRWRLLTAAAGWLVSVVVLLPVLFALALTWQTVRQRLDGALAPDPLAVVPQIVALAAVWVAGLVLAGFASALRGALWGMQELRE
jgi:hypothetical protein